MVIGRRIGDGGRYEVIQALDEGGMARVFEAHDHRMQSRVAIKLLDPALAHNPRIRERFRREGLIQANLSHRNVVKTTDIIDDGEFLGLVMELVDGSSLQAELNHRGRYSLWEIWLLIQPILSAISAAHHMGVVHRDLKPSNIMLVRSAGEVTPLLLDFGIAKLLDDPDGAPMTQVGSRLGTPAYMSPEQLQGAADVDHRCDIYALGVIVYQLATGQLPFPETDEYAVISRVLKGPPPEFPSKMAPDLGVDFDQIVFGALTLDPNQRFQTVEAFGGALHALVASRYEGVGTGPFSATGTTSGPRPIIRPISEAPRLQSPVPATVIEAPQPTFTPAPSPPRSGSPRDVVAALAFVIVLAVVVAVVLLRSNDTDAQAAFSYPQCRSESDCRSGESCDSGRCAVPGHSPAQQRHVAGTPGEQAKQVYRSAISAYQRSDRSYFDYWAYPICLYQRYNKKTGRPWTRDEYTSFRKPGASVINIESLRIVWERPALVMLEERNNGTNSKGVSYNATRRIALRKIGGAWKIVAEGNAQTECMPQ